MNDTSGRELGVHIDLLGWEDTLPAMGRPQATINRDVDECDLFIGLLWRRWGTPTGETTSGFHEEYRRALDRYKQTKAPEIWLAFKQIDQGTLGDPGEQLKQVLAFKAEVTNERELLYKEFDTTDGWERLLRGWLSRRVAQLAKQQSEPPAPSVQASDTSPSKIVPLAAGSRSPEPLPPEVKAAASTLSNNTQHTERGLLEALSEPATLLRLHLLLAAHASFLKTNDLFTEQAAASAYAFRAAMTLTQVERLVLFRTLVADESDVIPGWFWLRALDERFPSRAAELAVADPDERVRSGSLRFLGLGTSLPAELLKLDHASRVLGDPSHAVRLAAMETYSALATRGDLPLFQNLSRSPEQLVRESASTARIHLLARVLPAEFLLIQPEDDSTERAMEEACPLFAASVSAVLSNILLSSVRHPSREIRRIVAAELARRGVPGQDDSPDRSDLTRALVRVRLYRLKQPYDPRDFSLAPNVLSSKPDSAVSLDVQQYLRTRPVEELVLRAHSVFTDDCDLAYRVLATEHFEQVRTTIREDIRDSFSRLVQRRIDELEQMGVVTGETASQVSLIGHRLISAKYVAAALDALVVHGSPEDAELARLTLQKPSAGDDALLAATRLLQKFGNSSDARLLSDVAYQAKEAVKERAFQAALHLDPDPEGTVKAGLASEDPEISRWSLLHAMGHPSPAQRPAVIERLSSPEPAVRLAATAYLLEHLPHEELLKALDDYLRQGKHYLSVVCWIDRVLYAPPAFRDGYRRRLLDLVHNRLSPVGMKWKYRFHA